MGFCLVPVLGVLSSLVNILQRKRELVALLLLCCGSFLCSASFPHGAVGWSAVCDCGIF